METVLFAIVSTPSSVFYDFPKDRTSGLSLGLESFRKATAKLPLRSFLKLFRIVIIHTVHSKEL